jgi:Tol biopolymer transport system component
MVPPVLASVAGILLGIGGAQELAILVHAAPLAAQQEPRFFAPGVVTVPQATTYRPTFTADGRTAIYSMEVGSGYVLLQTRLSGGRWGPPEVLPFSGVHSDAEAALSPDGSLLVFASRRPRPGGEPRADYDLWAVERSATGAWGIPRPLDELSTAAHELYPSITADGTLYFTRASPEGSDLWRAARRGGGYAPPERVAEVNSDRREAGGFVDAAGRVLLFESNRAGSLGGTDLFVSCRQGASWGPARHLDAPLSSAANETSPVLSPDGRALYFTSNRRSPGAAHLGPGTTYAGLLRSLSAPGNGLWHTYEVPAPDLCPAPPAS